MTSFLAGAARTLAIVSLFVAGGVTSAVLAGAPLQRGESRAGAPPSGTPEASVYTGGMAGDAPESPPRVWLVDGFNALHVGVLGGRERTDWWREAAREELLARIRGFDAGGAEIWVVFDGARPAPEGGDAPMPHVVFAPSADDWLLARIRGAEEPAAIAVVTADRRLAARARHRGARVVTPGAFLSRCSSV
jgi:hypothetical protein